MKKQLNNKQSMNDTNMDCTEALSYQKVAGPETKQGRRHGIMDTSAVTADASGDRVATTYLDNIKTTETNLRVYYKPYDYRIIKSGDIIESYKYSHTRYKRIIDKGSIDKEKKQTKKRDKTKNRKTLNDKKYKRDIQTIYNTKRKLKRLINANVGQYEPYKDKFITLTFKEYSTREQVIQSFKLFNKRLRYQYKEYPYQYIMIIERGTRGTKRLHIHCLFFGLPYIPIETFRKIWEYGNVDMKAIKKYGDVANYILKYVEKTLQDDSYIAKGKKFYITSMHLKKPQSLYLTEEESKIFLRNKEGLNLIYQTDFHSLFVGHVHYDKWQLPEYKSSIKK